jgi:hypothetical protein
MRTMISQFYPLLTFLASLTQQELPRQIVFQREEDFALHLLLPKRIVAT